MIGGKRRFTIKKFPHNLFKKSFSSLIIGKRQRFVASVLVLSIGLFLSELILGKSSVFAVVFLSILTDLLLYLSLRRDLKEFLYLPIFILPFFYSLSFGLFYLLVPARFLTRIIMTLLYGIGLYSLFLSENIFTVSSMRTIALLGGARTVTFAITLITYFFLSNVIFSMHLNVFITLFLIFCYTFPIIMQSIWIHTLSRSTFSEVFWVLFLTICLFEISIILWFWPSTPTLIALFLTGFFYTIVGLSQVWFDRRLFKSVIIEYIWVSLVVFTVLVIFTSWV